MYVHACLRACVCMWNLHVCVFCMHSWKAPPQRWGRYRAHCLGEGVFCEKFGSFHMLSMGKTVLSIALLTSIYLKLMMLVPLCPPLVTFYICLYLFFFAAYNVFFIPFSLASQSTITSFLPGVTSHIFYLLKKKMCHYHVIIPIACHSCEDCKLYYILVNRARFSFVLSKGWEQRTKMKKKHLYHNLGITVHYYYNYCLWFKRGIIMIEIMVIIRIHVIIMIIINCKMLCSVWCVLNG